MYDRDNISDCLTFFDLQHRQNTALSVISSISTVSTTFGFSFLSEGLTRLLGFGLPSGQKAKYDIYVMPARAAVGGIKENQSRTTNKNN